MAARKKINIGVVGLGYWGPNLVRNFSEVDNCHVAMACDSDERKLKPIKKRYPYVEVTTRYEDIVDAKDIDAIAVATPVVSHYELAKRALEKGKHVLVEKPLCANVKEAEGLIKVAESNGKVLMVDHTFLYTGSVRKAKELISKGEIGEVYYFDSVRINLGLFRTDVNVIWDLAPHDISIAQYLIKEEPVSVSVLGRDFNNNKIACIAYMTLRYKSGIIAHIHVSWLSPVKIRRIIIGGSKSMIIYDDVEPTEKIKVYDSGIKFDYGKENPLEPTYRLGDINLPRLDQREALSVEAEHFIDCILRGRKPLTDANFGLDIVKVLEASDTSLREGGRLVKL
jgi:predicted dehydrogenase